jgi:hypothetical protein
VWHADSFTGKSGTTTAVQLRAGTSLSSRMRRDQNDLNVIDKSGDRIAVELVGFNEDTGRFETTEARQFNRASDLFSD